MNSKSTHTRRNFCFSGAIAGSSLLLAALPTLAAEKAAEQPQKEKPKAVEDVSPTEDLMREHGLFERILLIYEESMRRIIDKKGFDLVVLNDTAKIVRIFIEDYHSKLEEDQVFTRFEKAGKFVDLVKVLRVQHQAGRLITDQVLQKTVVEKSLDGQNSQKLVNIMGQFIRMYRPHLAREDTIVFPAMHDIVTPEEYDILGDEFEDREHELFGDKGFENMVEKVAGIEKSLGIYELSKFTAG
jgi:hemerythrin-like domain-containing protein